MPINPTIRRAFTMVELLIVVAIAMLLIAIAIPFIRPGIETSRLREGARLVNTFINGAKARAADMGRPFGVRLVRSSVDGTGDPNDCYRLQYVEVPPAYSGDFDNATITVGPRHMDGTVTPPVPVLGPLIAANPYSGYASNVSLSFSAWLNCDTIILENNQSQFSQILHNSIEQFVLNSGETVQEAWDRANKTAVVTPGDSIRFGYQGITYLIVDMYMEIPTDPMLAPIPRLTLAPIYGDGPLAGVSHWPANPAAGVNQPYTTSQIKPYQIFRKPQVAGATVLELPRNTSIDLALSGNSFGGSEFFANYDPALLAAGQSGNSPPAGLATSTYSDPTPIDIIFDPNGQMTNLVVRGIVKTTNSSVYLHLGRTEHVYSGIGGRKGEDWSSGGAPRNEPGSELINSANLKSNDDYWIAIQYPTGAVLAAENLAGDAVLGVGTTKLSDARNLVRSGVAKGSR